MCQSAQYEPPNSWNLETNGSPLESQQGHAGGSSDQARNQQLQLGSQMVPRGLHGFQQRLERIGVRNGSNPGLCMSGGQAIRLAEIGLCRSTVSRAATLFSPRFPGFGSGVPEERSTRNATRNTLHNRGTSGRPSVRAPNWSLSAQPSSPARNSVHPQARTLNIRRLLGAPNCGLVYLSNCTR
jgi:hypothetical protein